MEEEEREARPQAGAWVETLVGEGPRPVERPKGSTLARPAAAIALDQEGWLLVGLAHGRRLTV